MKNKPVTIRDVAKAAAVSTQTVSRVLNNRPDVAPGTRAHVQETIDRLGYAPNIIARNLSRGRSNTLGVIGYGLNFYGSSSTLTGIENKVNDLGFSLTLRLIDQIDPARVDDLLYDLLSQRVEGIIWAVPGDINTFDWLPEKFSTVEIPMVYVNKGPTNTDFIVALDNRKGGNLAAAHLINQGYQKIGIISGPKNWWEARQRVVGWREIVEAAGSADIDRLIVEGDWNPPSGAVGLQKLLDRNPDLDGVFISNDQMSLGALQVTRQLGLRVPEDFGIVGFDDIPEAAYFYPSLTTVRQNTRKLGALAVERMHALIQARRENEALEPKVSWVEPRLIIRRSTEKR
jgi:DNA-binding LacI/PurR family transcriptional regulator